MAGSNANGVASGIAGKNAFGEGPVGLISYMRTDSVNLADEALAELRELIAKRFGKENVPEAPRAYKTKSKNAQEAHEAIRPTSAMRVPKEIKTHLTEVGRVASN